MGAEVYERFQSGEICIESGRYEFDGYVQGPAEPPPQISELETSLGVGDTFPPTRADKRPCYWKLVEGVTARRASGTQPAPEIV